MGRGRQLDRLRAGGHRARPGPVQGRTRQYIFISSASVYQKPPTHPVFTESTPLYNPFWEYSRNKIACEERLNRAYREDGFPMTIVRPPHTYGQYFPLAIGGWNTYTLPTGCCARRAGDRHTGTAPRCGRSPTWMTSRWASSGCWVTQAIGHAFHITSDESLTWNQIYGTIAEALGVTPNFVYIPSDFIARVSPQIGGACWEIRPTACCSTTPRSRPSCRNTGRRSRSTPESGAPWPGTYADPARKWVDPAINAEMDRILAAYAGRGRKGRRQEARKSRGQEAARPEKSPPV
jgi:hypothetical protein